MGSAKPIGANTLAAAAAQTRAAECRERLRQLAHRRRVAIDDVRAARLALERAQHRAELARQRLIEVRLRRLFGPPYRLANRTSRPADAPPPDLTDLRAVAREMAPEALFAAYFAIGGECSPLELDAFVHAALQLPPDEVAVVVQAVWELTEF